MSRRGTQLVAMASATLAATETAQTGVALPPQCSGGWLEISYARHASSTTGYPSVRVQVSADGGTTYSDVGVLDTTTPSSPMILYPLALRFATAAGTQRRGMPVDLGVGLTHLRVQTYDAGDATNRGTSIVLFTSGVE